MADSVKKGPAGAAAATFDPISLPSHIRVKRHKLCLFIHCDLRVDTVMVIKERLEKLTGVPVMKQRLYLGNQLLANSATLWDSGVEVEDTELFLIFSTGIDQRTDVESWEDVATALAGPPAAAAANTSAVAQPPQQPAAAAAVAAAAAPAALTN
jgi:hypothetical protein